MPQINKPVAHAVARRLSLQPLLTVPDSAIEMDMTRFLSMAQEDREDEDALHETWKAEVVAGYGMQPNNMEKPYAFSNGVAVIPIHGMLINRFGGSWGWITGYQYLSRMSMTADADPDVELIVYDVNSGGGEVAGCSEAGAIIAGVEKPTLAIVDTRCYSAAYWLASQADKIISTPSGGAGSVGAMTMHMDVSEMMENVGLKVTLMYAGKHKVDGNQFEKLDPEVKAKTEARLAEIRQEFAETVADGRKISVESVLATEADCYTAQQAVDLKLIDAIGEPSSVILNAMTRMADGYSPFDDEDEENDEDDEMTTAANKPKPAATVEDTVATVDAKQIEADSRARMKAINTHAMASSQPALVGYLAYETDFSADVVCAILDTVVVPTAVAPVVETDKAETDPNKNGTKAEQDGNKAFTQAMATTENPELKPNQQEKAEVSQLDKVLSLLPQEMQN